jgi:dTMP kinase
LRAGSASIAVLALNVNAIRGILPDVTFLLLVDPEEARRRAGPPGDRIEREGDEFCARSTRRTVSWAPCLRGRITMLDASRSVDEVAKEVRDRLPSVFLSRRTRAACSTRRWPRGRRTRTSSTGRPGVGKRRAALGFAGALAR